jgi:hypothetical protein
MKFFPYDEDSRLQFDESTQAVLDRLATAYGLVEVREIATSNEWCVRVTIIDDTGEKLPLAALGDTVRDSAERLVRICALGADDWKDRVSFLHRTICCPHDRLRNHSCIAILAVFRACEFVFSLRSVDAS